MNQDVKLIIESIIMGIITLIMGTIVFNLSVNRKNQNNNKPFGISLAFFMTGFIIHFVLNIIGFEQWYCDKTTLFCYSNLAKL